MGEIWPKKKSAGRRSIIEGSVLVGAGGGVEALLQGGDGCLLSA